MDDYLGVYTLSKEFLARKVIDNVSFTIKEGEIFGLIGPSGCGKTTLLKLLMGYYVPNSGYISFEGKHLGNSNFSKKFGFSSQSSAYYEELTVAENLLFYGQLYNVPQGEIRQRIDLVLPLVGMENQKNSVAKSLSGGMQRRLDIACALIHNPDVLILDEPTEGLDPVLRRALWKLIRAINKQKTTIIIASHLLDEVENLCNRVALLKDGKIITMFSPEQLKIQRVAYQIVSLETRPGNYQAVLSHISKQGLKYRFNQNEEGKVTIHTNEPEKMMYYLMQAVRLESESLIHIELKKPGLEDLFENLVAK